MIQWVFGNICHHQELDSQLPIGAQARARPTDGSDRGFARSIHGS